MKNTDLIYYKKFLNTYLTEKKKSRPSFSIGSWARILGLKSTASLSKVLKGERLPGKTLTKKLVHYLKLNEEQSYIFHESIRIEKLKITSDEKENLFSRLKINITKNEQKIIDEKDYRILLKNHLSISIRELLTKFTLKEEQIYEVFSSHKASKINKSLTDLLKAKLIKKNILGEYVANDEYLETANDIPNDLIKLFHIKNLELAKNNIRKTDILSRDFQSLIFLINTKKVYSLKKKIRTFIEEVSSESLEKSPNQMYQLQIQLFPVTNQFYFSKER